MGKILTLEDALKRIEEQRYMDTIRRDSIDK